MKGELNFLLAELEMGGGGGEGDGRAVLQRGGMKDLVQSRQTDRQTAARPRVELQHIYS